MLPGPIQGLNKHSIGTLNEADLGSRRMSRHREGLRGSPLAKVAAQVGLEVLDAQVTAGRVALDHGPAK